MRTTAAPKDTGQERQRASSVLDQANLPVDWDFGQIKTVDYTTYLLQVVLFRGESGSTEVAGWHPIIKGQEGIRIIQEQYGKIRAGMCCIVHWRGDEPEPGKTYIQIIGKGPGCGPVAVASEPTPVENELATGPFKAASGGLA